MFKQLKLVIISTYLLALPLLAQATLVPPKLFDLKLTPNHDNAAHHAMPAGTNPQEWLLPKQAQEQHFQRMQENWFAPWNAAAVNKQIARESYPKVLASIVRSYRNEIKQAQNCKDNPNGQFPVIQKNYRPFDCKWLDAIVANANYTQFEQLQYDASNRAIITHNSFVRVFPSSDTYYRRFKSGNINPFDRLQMSVVWAGTPIYVLGTTLDRAWHYIYTQSYSGWVQAKDVAFVDENFVQAWQFSDDELIAIMQNSVSLNNNRSGRYITQVGIGAIFPGTQEDELVRIKVPVNDPCGSARIVYAEIDNTMKKLALPMPVAPTRENFAYVMQDMVSRPYTWGGACFFTDCSLELKNIYTPFGVWLARHSKSQTDGVKLEKLDSMHNYQQRVDYLRKHGKPFMTLIYIGGHIMLYAGVDENNSPVLYQNMWLAHGSDRNREPRIVGQSIFMPSDVKGSNTFSMIDPNITRYFWLAHLDEPI